MMKDWKVDHPKAKLMARKRAAILDAARGAFLRLGYEGATMEAIAAAADVSIMTLYRHAPSKDDLFAAVVTNACDPANEAKQAKIAALMTKPLEEILVWSGVMIQEKLAHPDTTALLLAVMAEGSRFPHLAQMAYRGFVMTYEEAMATVLAQKEEARGVDAMVRRRLSRAFVSRLIGADLLRVLLGLGGASTTERQARAEAAADELLSAVVAAPGRKKGSASPPAPAVPQKRRARRD